MNKIMSKKKTNLKIERFLIIILYSLFLYSCCTKNIKTIYKYSNTRIIRIDKCSETTFYYQNENNFGKIWAEYAGINDGFKGYLRFEENGKVTVLSGDGYFQTKNLDTTLFNYKRIYAYNRSEIKENLCEIMLSTHFERINNKKSASKIKIIYNAE